MTEGPASKHTQSRRKNLYWLTAGAATVGGAVFAWRQTSPSAPGLSPLEQELWSLKLTGPSGEPVAMNAFHGKKVVINFWATWCPPCVEELPMLSRFQVENAKQDWQVVGLAVDQSVAVVKFLQKMPLAFPVAIANTAGLDLSRKLGNDRGGLPFTVVLNRQGLVTQRKIGQLSSSDLQGWVHQVN